MKCNISIGSNNFYLILLILLVCLINFLVSLPAIKADKSNKLYKTEKGATSFSSFLQQEVDELSMFSDIEGSEDFGESFLEDKKSNSLNKNEPKTDKNPQKNPEMARESKSNLNSIKPHGGIKINQQTNKITFTSNKRSDKVNKKSDEPKFIQLVQKSNEKRISSSKSYDNKKDNTVSKSNSREELRKNENFSPISDIKADGQSKINLDKNNIENKNINNNQINNQLNDQLNNQIDNQINNQIDNDTKTKENSSNSNSNSNSNNDINVLKNKNKSHNMNDIHKVNNMPNTNTKQNHDDNSTSESLSIKNNSDSESIKPNIINNTKKIASTSTSDEKNKLFSELDPNFVKNLLKIQNDPTIKNLINNKPDNLEDSLSNISTQKEENSNFSNRIASATPFNPPNFRFKEKVAKKMIRNYFKPEELDMSKLNYINESISKVRSEVQKKTMENDQLAETNSQLEKTYENLNSQVLVYQTKMDSIMNEINNYNSMKGAFESETEKVKEGNNLISDMTDFFKRINSDITAKENTIGKYEEKVKKDLDSFELIKAKLEQTKREKSKNLESVKNSYDKTEKAKLKLIEDIKLGFENYSKEEIKFIKLKNEENQLELKVKEEENAEKLIAMEIEHLKATNMIEIQKIEELKSEIEKSKNLRDYLKRDIDELEEKLKNVDNENKQSQLEYELKKNELNEKLKTLKDEVKNEEALNNEEKEKYNQIENDIKSKISYLTLQNSNVLGTTSRSNIINNEEPEKIQDKEKFYSFIAKDKPSDESKLQKQILKLLKKLNE